MSDGPTPMEGARPRKTGDHLTPEGATPRVTTDREGGRIRPEGTQPGPSGDAMTPDIVQGEKASPVAVGPMGSDETKSPFGSGLGSGNPFPGTNINPLK